MKMTVTPIVIGTLRTILKGLAKGQEDLSALLGVMFSNIC